MLVADFLKSYTAKTGCSSMGTAYIVGFKLYADLYSYPILEETGDCEDLVKVEILEVDQKNLYRSDLSNLNEREIKADDRYDADVFVCERKLAVAWQDGTKYDIWVYVSRVTTKSKLTYIPSGEWKRKTKW